MQIRCAIIIVGYAREAVNKLGFLYVGITRV